MAHKIEYNNIIFTKRLTDLRKDTMAAIKDLKPILKGL